MIKRGQQVLVRATVNAPTNAKEPTATGNWWVQIDGMVGLTSVPESAIVLLEPRVGDKVLHRPSGMIFTVAAIYEKHLAYNDGIAAPGELPIDDCEVLSVSRSCDFKYQR